MAGWHWRRGLRAAAEQAGMLAVLAAVCAALAVLTWGPRRPEGAEAGKQIAAQARAAGCRFLLVLGRDHPDDRAFAAGLTEAGPPGARLEKVLGVPADARKALERFQAAGPRPDAIAATAATDAWPFLDDLDARFPALQGIPVWRPIARGESAFLQPANLLNVADQVVVISIVASGMTLVVLTGGIDLSVGSVMALSAVAVAWLVQRWGGAAAGTAAMAAGGAAAVLLATAVGLASGFLVAWARVPPFVATLATMLIASGAAFQWAGGQSIHDLPANFIWLGRGVSLRNLPNGVLLAVATVAAMQALVRWTVLGRRLLAVGGNPEAARLAGVPTRVVVLSAYGLCGGLAGLAGVVEASKLHSGSPTYGANVELYAIAAVVVGGTRLSGGAGSVVGSLVGALILGVVQNGMNLLGLGSYAQKIVLGAVLLAAVLWDRLRPGCDAGGQRRNG